MKMIKTFIDCPDRHNTWKDDVWDCDNPNNPPPRWICRILLERKQCPRGYVI